MEYKSAAIAHITGTNQTSRQQEELEGSSNLKATSDSKQRECELLDTSQLSRSMASRSVRLTPSAQNPVAPNVDAGVSRHIHSSPCYHRAILRLRCSTGCIEPQRMRGRVEAQSENSYMYEWCFDIRNLLPLCILPSRSTVCLLNLAQNITSPTIVFYQKRTMLPNAFFLALMTASASAHFMQVTTWSGKNCHGSSEIGCKSNAFRSNQAQNMSVSETQQQAAH